MSVSTGTPVPLRIDFVSDVVCPWCAIGLASLEAALARLDGEVNASIHLQPFELDPQMPPEGVEIAENLQRKYGMGEAELAQNRARIAARGAELGFVFDMKARSRTWNTFDAHRLLHWAADSGKALALKWALLRAHFTHGRNVSDREVLVELAAGCGLDPDTARTVLESGAFADEVRQDERFFQERGIRSVPAAVIEGRHLISGGQPPEVFEQALRQIAAEKAGEMARGA